MVNGKVTGRSPFLASSGFSDITACLRLLGFGTSEPPDIGKVDGIGFVVLHQAASQGITPGFPATGAVPSAQVGSVSRKWFGRGFSAKNHGTVPGKNTMYHSGVNDKDSKTIGRSASCDLHLEHDSVSRLHATVRITPEGYLALQDAGSSNGTFLNRHGHWVRARRVVLGTRDRLRLGEHELPLDELVDLFGESRRVRLREGYSARGRPLVFAGDPGQPSNSRVVLENPRRNPVTGDIEENR
jgi:hypothetical protein